MQTGTRGVSQTSSPAGFLRSLFDLSFSSFITLGIVKVLYVISLILVLLYALFLGGSAASGTYGLVGVPELGGSPALGIVLGLLAFLVLFPLVLVLGAIYVRVLLELVVVLFRIAENTGELVRQGGGSGEFSGVRSDLTSGGRPGRARDLDQGGGAAGGPGDSSREGEQGPESRHEERGEDRRE